MCHAQNVVYRSPRHRRREQGPEQPGRTLVECFSETSASRPRARDVADAVRLACRHSSHLHRSHHLICARRARLITLPFPCAAFLPGGAMRRHAPRGRRGATAPRFSETGRPQVPAFSAPNGSPPRPSRREASDHGDLGRRPRSRAPRARARGRGWRVATRERRETRVRIAGWFLRLLELRPRPAARRAGPLAAGEAETRGARHEKRAPWMGGETPRLGTIRATRRAGSRGA